MNKDRERSKRMVLTAEKAGFTALAITVDAPSLGRREKDMRNKQAAVSHAVCRFMAAEVRY